MDGKIDNGAMNGNSNYHHAPGTIDNPTTSLSSEFDSAYQSQGGEQQLSQAGHMVGFLGAGTPNEPDQADMLVAGLLTDLSSHGAHNSAHNQPANSFVHGSRGRLNTFGHNMTHDSPQSPLTSSGRQSSAGLHPTHTQNPGFLYSQQQQIQHMQARLAQSQQQGHSRHPSFPSAPTPTYPYNQHFPQQQLPYSTLQGSSQGRPPLPHTFGSDPNFGTGGFYGNSYMARQQQDKASNLMNVPMAQQLAATGRHNPQGYDYMTQQRTHGMANVPNGRRNIHSQSSSPGSFGGLPISSPSSNTPQQAPVWPQPRNVQTARPARERDETVEQHPRKRRKSQMEREDEAEYTPTMNAQDNVPRRGPKVPKAEEGSDDDASGPATNTASVQRRKSGETGRSHDSNASGSPAAEATGGRKKRGDAKSRQNLTDKEKRQNHILSEQKRRNMIKECFADLETMVPSLANGKAGFSKSEALKEVIAMIENTLSGNGTVSEGLGLDETELDVNDADENYDTEPRGVGIFG